MNLCPALPLWLPGTRSRRWSWMRCHLGERHWSGARLVVSGAAGKNDFRFTAFEIVASLLPVVGSVPLNISLGKIHLEGLEFLASAVHFSNSHVRTKCFVMIMCLFQGGSRRPEKCLRLLSILKMTGDHITVTGDRWNIEDLISIIIH